VFPRLPARWTFVVVAAVLALTAGGCGGSGPPGGGAAGSSSAPVAGGSGFGTVRVLVRNAEGELTWCLLLAATEAQRERGLMGVTDAGLNGFPGMLFRYPVDHAGGF
jgi:hypothetical protein